MRLISERVFEYETLAPASFVTNFSSYLMSQQEPSIRQIELRAYSKKELAELYKISGKSLKTWLTPFETEIGPRVGRFYSPKQIRVIFERLGFPEMIST